MMTISARDNENNTWKRSTPDRKKQRGDASYSESVKANWFCSAFKLGFFQLIFKASLILKLNFELPLSIILKERESYE